MALRVDYVVRETATNLKRNLTLTFATVVTIAIALTLVGASLLMKQGVNRSNVRFRGNVQTIVYMKADASQDQIDAVGRGLDQNPNVQSKRYLDHDAANQEFREIFADEPAIRDSLTPQETPTSYKVHVKNASSEVVDSLKSQFQEMPGVFQVMADNDAIRRQESSFAKFRSFSLLFAAIVGATSLVLIVNSIRIAMFARRREIEVMKLVGATNWFIRIPFMAEGLVQGILGSAAGIGIVVALRSWLLPTLVSGGGIWAGFRLELTDVQGTGIVMIIAGAIVGIFGSAVAATRFLDV
jgi:cell division transport system permease protein